MNISEMSARLRRNERVQAWIQIVLGCLIGGMAYPLFLTPCSIAPGGLTGVATILNHFFGLPVGMTSLAMNIPLFLLGWKRCGRLFAVRSLCATVLFSAAIDLWALEPMTDDPILASVYGGVVLGVGLGLILRGGATTGGTDMIAQIVHKRFSFITVGMFLFAIDCVVVVAAGVTMGKGQALYALIAIYVSSRVIDVVMVGFTANKVCFIITAQWEPVTRRILSEMDRGATQLQARGAYSGESRPVLMCVISRQELARLKAIVREEDPNAFMFVSEAHEAMGEGFSDLRLE